MARIEKTVFISYRRKDVALALAVYQYLTSRDYDVFFDYTSIPIGDFERVIISNIRARAHFLLILTPTALDRCNEPGDWLRREIETAIDEKRNIVPLCFEGFKFSQPVIAEKLTGKLGVLPRYNALNIPAGYFSEAIDRLVSQFLNVELKAVIHPVPAEVRTVVKEEQRAVNHKFLTTRKARSQSKPILEPEITSTNKKVSLSKQVFISYSRHDADFAAKISEELANNKIQAWIDHIGIRGGEEWPERIASAILASKIVLAIVSPDALNSKWVNRELSFADKNEKLVFPLIYRTCKIPDWFDLRFGNTQWADFTYGEYDANITTLLASLKKSLAK